MPSGKNWINFLYINLAFAIYIAGIFYYTQLANIKANWPLYRCNPMYMFLADNVEENFTYCVQSTQTNFMGYLLQPITFVTNNLSAQMGGFMNDIQNIRAMFNKIRTFFSSIIENIFGVFLNLVIEFQRITIGIKDLIAKTIGIMTALMFMLDGSVKTMNSTWKAPPGQLVRALGKCFHPDTLLKLKNGKTVQMQNINLGDILEDGSVVETVMKIDNKKEQIPFYSIQTKNGTNVLVTGSHLILDKDSNKYIKVENYKNAKATYIINNWFSCLITDTHRIRIDDEIFWDWEDHFMKYSFD